MGNQGEKKKAKANAETLLYAKIFIAVCHVSVAPSALHSARSSASADACPAALLPDFCCPSTGSLRRPAHLLQL